MKDAPNLNALPDSTGEMLALQNNRTMRFAVCGKPENVHAELNRLRQFCRDDNLRTHWRFTRLGCFGCFAANRFDFQLFRLEPLWRDLVLADEISAYKSPSDLVSCSISHLLFFVFRSRGVKELLNISCRDCRDYTVKIRSKRHYLLYPC